MELSDTVVAALVVGAAVLALVALVAAGVALGGQRHVRRAYRVLGEGGREDVLVLLHRHIDEVEALRADVGDLRARGEHVRGLVAGCVSRVATLRYDAFDDMGGHLSYSTALLDERGDGVVLTSIHGRTDTRTYAKPVEAGESPHTLSSEERTVIGQALEGRDRVPPRVASGQRDAS